MDPTTAHALTILARLVKSSPDRKGARALDHLRHHIDSGPALTPAAPMLSRHEREPAASAPIAWPSDAEIERALAVSTRRREPSEAQWRAVRTALEKFCGLGQWGSHAG